MSVYAIIPARGGSKGTPRKNIAPLAGFPLIAYAIAAARLTPSIERIIVSTDDEEIASIARKFGAETPFMRPKEFARDDSRDLEFLLHAIEWFKENESSVPDLLVELRATTPLRRPEDVEKAIHMIQKYPEASSLLSGHEIRESPYKLFGIEGDHFRPLYPDDPRPEYWNMPRQTFPPIFQPNGYVDILRSDYIYKNKRQHGDDIVAFVSHEPGEIDRPSDFEFLSYKLQSEPWEVYDWLKEHFS